jgi:hypothetical protein
MSVWRRGGELVELFSTSHPVRVSGVQLYCDKMSHLPCLLDSILPLYLNRLGYVT